MSTNFASYPFPKAKRYNVDFEGQYTFVPLRDELIVLPDPTRHVKHIMKYLEDKAQWYENGQTILVSWRAREEDWKEWWGQRFVLQGGIWWSLGEIFETSWDKQNVDLA